MAEFMNTPRVASRMQEIEGDSGFAAFGKPVSTERRSEALKHIREMGIANNADAWECIGNMSGAIERDQPYECVGIGMRYVDLTGTYRLMAVLCADASNEPHKPTRAKSSQTK